MTGGEGEFQLDNPMLVRWEFASEERLQTRNSIYRSLIEGVNAEDLVFDAVREAQPKRVLEVGCGAGEMAERIAKELAVEVTAVDISSRMVDLARERGVRAAVGDILELPYADGEFDCVVAAWLLYHVRDRDRAIRECARVLVPGGTLVASTMADENLGELWAFLGSPRERNLTFSSSNGAAQLGAHFARVEAREAEGRVVFPTPASMRMFVAANMTRAHLAVDVPEFAEPVQVGSHHTVFVAQRGE